MVDPRDMVKNVALIGCAIVVLALIGIGALVLLFTSGALKPG